MARNYRSVAEPKTLSGDVNNSTTQITLSDVTGLPSPPYVLVLSPDTASEEVVLVVTDDTLTAPTVRVQRAIETGATAKSHTNGNVVRHMIVGSDLQLVHDHLDNTSTAHGVTGAVVGTTSSQTLTNKTLTTPKINENVNLTATSTELNVLDGITASTAELNIMDGVTSTTAELNILDGVTSTTAELNILDGVTSTAAEINILDGLTADTAELNILDGATLTTTELNYVDGVTSSIQTQLTNNTPVGMLVPYAGASAPTGWLLCWGQPISRTTYSALFTALGGASSPYGLPDGATFNVPDLRGRVVAGIDNMGGTDAGRIDWDNVLGTAGGAQTLPLHSHTIDHDHGSFDIGGGAHQHAINTAIEIAGSLANDTAINYLINAKITGANYLVTNSGEGGHGHSVDMPNFTGTSGNTGTGTHGVMQPTILLNYIIKH